MLFTARMKQMMVWAITVATLQMMAVPAWADAAAGVPVGPTAVTDPTSEGYLQQIATYTQGTMTAVNNIPFYLLEITTAMFAWLNPDTSTTTANLQSAFTNYYASLNTSTTVLPAYGAAITADLLSGANANTLPNANDISYETLLGTKILNPDPRDSGSSAPTDSIYNYIRNAAGYSIVHVMPSTSWNGMPGDQTKYKNYYNTVMTAETYDAFVLGQLYADTIAAVPTNQKVLTDLADGSDFFSQVASEAVGIVLRQILMFESQSFILQTQILKTQKQILTTQALANTLMINNGGTSEQLLLHKAIVKTQAQ